MHRFRSRVAASMSHGVPRMRSPLLAWAVLVVLGAPLPAAAHHSTANFDQNKANTFTGTVRYFSFTSPHSFFDMDVMDKAGTVRHYKVFSVAKVVMVRSGWTGMDLKIGDTVTVTTNPDKKDPSYVYLQKIVFASGKIW